MAAIVAALWLQASRPAWAPRAIAALARPSVARRWLAWQMAALLAALPADLVLSGIWQNSLVVFQSTIASRSGPIPVEDTVFLRLPYSEMVEPWALPAESIVLRGAATDGMILQQRGFAGWQPFDPLQPLPPQLAKYLWGAR